MSTHFLAAFLKMLIILAGTGIALFEAKSG